MAVEIHSERFCPLEIVRSKFGQQMVIGFSMRPKKAQSSAPGVPIAKLLVSFKELPKLGIGDKIHFLKDTWATNRPSSQELPSIMLLSTLKAFR